ncbi:uncharacterized protein LOC111188896 [Astyanax mexicanus]|uniref:uncharacterized protein LOC111188896 n=1 Tax=Astyanax mexicanus TaxID=7994 RepID=UPI0020CAFC91|nr:uncharacterized protein LOC111188896 [Astyanax mexicanus]
MSLIKKLLRRTERKHSKKKLIKWLQKERLLARTLKCPRCGKKMHFKKKTSIKDGYTWICRRNHHRQNTVRSIRHGSIFSRSHVPLVSYMKHIHRFAQGLRLRQVDMVEEGLCGSSATITKLTQKLKGVCVNAIRKMKRQKKMQIGGGRAYVVLDESKFCHKRKYARGRFGNTWRRKAWVFGMMEIKRNRRRPLLKVVKRRTAAKLIPAIQKYVRCGTTVISDEWPAYKQLGQHGYIHYQVNHKRFFVHPQTGAHTQHIERAWRTFKNEVYRYRGNLTKKSLKDQLAFIEWNYWRGKSHPRGVLGCLFEDIGLKYQV